MFLKGATFERSTFNESAEFSEAVFEETANFSFVRFATEARFGECQFPQETQFKSVVFEGMAEFDSAVFHGNANFSEAKFLHSVLYSGVIFKKGTSFEDVQFTEGAGFDGSCFEAEALFNRSRFLGGAAFRRVEFVGPALYLGTKFISGPADFGGTHFLGDTDFTSAEFVDSPSFNQGIQFHGRVTFDETKFHRGANLTPAEFKGHISFKNAHFLSEIPVLPWEALRVSVDFSGSILPSGPLGGLPVSALFLLRQFGMVHEEWVAKENSELKDYRAAEGAYAELRSRLDERNHYVDAGRFGNRELEMRRLAYLKSKKYFSLRRLWGELRANLLSLEALYCQIASYGGSWRKPLFALLLLLAIWPFLYAWSGVDLGKGQYSLEPIGNGLSLEPYANLIGFSLRNAALLSDPEKVVLNPGSQVLAVLIRIISPFLALLFALAVRRRFRR
ncbi:MAG: hypothetical protein JW395_0603 [Nitrospira sp.]|nr:hypothetical protein [Nitrospira sp.]